MNIFDFELLKYTDIEVLSDFVKIKENTKGAYIWNQKK